MSGEKRFFFSVVESAVLNPDYKGYRMARIEVFDSTIDSPYAIYEASVLLPEEFMDSFIEVFEFKESDLMPRIEWNCSTDGRKK